MELVTAAGAYAGSQVTASTIASAGMGLAAVGTAVGHAKTAYEVGKKGYAMGKKIASMMEIDYPPSPKQGSSSKRPEREYISQAQYEKENNIVYKAKKTNKSSFRKNDLMARNRLALGGTVKRIRPPGRSYPKKRIIKRKKRTKKRRTKRKGKKRKITAYNSPRGIGIIKENGFQNSDKKCIYVGHALAEESINFVFGLALMKWIFIKENTFIADIHDSIQFNGQVVCYRESIGKPGTTEVLCTIAFGPSAANATYASVGQQLGYYIMSNQRDNESIMTTLEFYRRDEDAASGVMKLTANYNFDDFKIDLDCRSRLVIQNTTLSATAGTDVENVRNNPLRCKRYTQVGNLNGFKVMARSGASTLYATTVNVTRAFVADPEVGFINTNYTVLAPPAPYTDHVFNKPPEKGFFGPKVLLSDKLLKPGELFEIFMNHEKRFSFRKFENLVFNWARATPNKGYYMPFGHADMFCMEKFLDARETSASDVSVQCELHQEYWCVVSHKKKTTIRTRPDINYGTAQVSSATANN
jgi:hypothetical protein